MLTVPIATCVPGSEIVPSLQSRVIRLLGLGTCADCAFMHCHLCDEAYANLGEFRRDDSLLFARPGDPFHDDYVLVRAYVEQAAAGMRIARQQAEAAGRTSTTAERETLAREHGDQVLSPDMPVNERRRIRRAAARLRVHPSQPEWLLECCTDAAGTQTWRAVPPVAYRWDLIQAYHDRTGHAGVSQTLRRMRMHFTWVGIKQDISACIKQCHPCQKRRLECEVVAEPVQPRMSGPMEHLHVDLAGPFPVKKVRVGPRRLGSVSTERVGEAYVLLVVDYFTKAAEFVVIENKRSETTARAFHDHWLCRFGVPVWITCDNGQEFGGAFRHQLDRLGVAVVNISPYNSQANGAVERLVRTMKQILFSKVALATHDWPALLPQVRAEYMDRVHSVTGFSPNDLVYTSKVKLPAPVGDLQWNPDEVWVTSVSAFRESSNERFERACSQVYDRILSSQRKSLERARRAAARLGGGKTTKRLAVGDLAYLVEPRGRKQHVSGPFVVTAVPREGSTDTVELRSTARVRGQQVRTYRAHPSLVARCWTVVDSLAELLKAAGHDMPFKASNPDDLSVWHASASGVS